MKKYRTETFPGVQMTAGQLRELIGDQTSDLAFLKLRSVRECPDAAIVCISADEVVALGGTVGTGVWQHTPGSPVHVVKVLCLNPHALTCGDLKMLAANSTLKTADVLATALEDAPADSKATIETELFEALQNSGHRRGGKQKPAKPTK